MNKSVNIIMELLSEIHFICKQNNIQYFVAGEIALCIYKGKGFPQDLDTAKVIMTSNNLKKFIKMYNGNKKENRAIEWMGNNENFSRVCLRYINTGTTYYTPYRVSVEKHLGMFVTIDVLRPYNKKEKVFRALESAWYNYTFDFPSKGMKLEPKLRKLLNLSGKVFGKKIISKLLVEFFFTKVQRKVFR